MPATTTLQAPVPSRPIVPRPLWERSDLFQEPVYAEGMQLLEDDDEEDV